MKYIHIVYSLENVINFSFGKKNILVTFHPVTLENSTAKVQFKELLDSINELQNTKIIFTKANSDTDGRIINSMIDAYVDDYDNTIAFKSAKEGENQLNVIMTVETDFVGSRFRPLLYNFSSSILPAIM